MRVGLLVVFLTLSTVATAVLVGVALTSRGRPAPQKIVQPKGYALRRIWFTALGALVVLAFAVSIPFFPYTSLGVPATRHFSVVAQQYAFTVPQTVPAAVPVVFDVTSRDVNHGFGIYAPDGTIVGQVQAMPNYVNHLRVTFQRPGLYMIRCLEYCGIVHPFMRNQFEVK